jgi:hypothetical protein
MTLDYFVERIKDECARCLSPLDKEDRLVVLRTLLKEVKAEGNKKKTDPRQLKLVE